VLAPDHDGISSRRIPADDCTCSSLSFNDGSTVNSPLIENPRFRTFLHSVHLMAKTDIVLPKYRGEGLRHHKAVVAQSSVFAHSVSGTKVSEANASQILESTGAHAFKGFASIGSFEYKPLVSHHKSDRFIKKFDIVEVAYIIH